MKYRLTQGQTAFTEIEAFSGRNTFMETVPFFGLAQMKQGMAMRLFIR